MRVGEGTGFMGLFGARPLAFIYEPHLHPVILPSSVGR